MSEENIVNANIPNTQLCQQEISNQEDQDVLNSEFFKSFETPKKLPEKKLKISNLIKFLKGNNKYFQSLKDSKKLLLLYDIIITNLIENNNNFVLAQIDLIEILSEQITNSENNEIKTDFISFYKKSLPKLFDKFYLQNQKINQNLLMIFDNSIKRNILKLKDYFPFIENICIEEDNEYKTNILNFLFEQINKDENILLENIPLNIIESIKKSNDTEDENLNEISKKIIDVLDNRNKKDEININDTNNINNDLLNIPSTPLSQQDSKLAFSSFIKKISKAVKQENLNKKMNNINNFNVLENTENDININTESNSNNKEIKENILLNEVIKKESFGDNNEALNENIQQVNINNENIIQNNQLNEDNNNKIENNEINNEKINIYTNNIIPEEETNKIEKNINENEIIDNKIEHDNYNNEINYVVEKPEKIEETKNMASDSNNNEINYVVEKQEKIEETKNIVSDSNNNEINYVVEKPEKKEEPKNITSDSNNNEINYVVEKPQKKEESKNIISDSNNNEINYVVEKPEKNDETKNIVSDSNNNIDDNKNTNTNNENKSPVKVKTHIKRPKSKGEKMSLKREDKKSEKELLNNNLENKNSNEMNIENKNSRAISENNNNQIQENEQKNKINEKKDEKKEETIEIKKEEKIKKDEKSNKNKDKDKKEIDEKDNKKSKNEKENSKKEAANNKKAYKSRITRSRKLGVLGKTNNKENKDSNKDKAKENKDKDNKKDNDNNKDKDNSNNKAKNEENKKNKENKDEKTSKISVNINKAKIKEKDKKNTDNETIETKEINEVKEDKEKKGKEIKEIKENKEEKEIKEKKESKEIKEIKEVKEAKEPKDKDSNNKHETKENESKTQNFSEKAKISIKERIDIKALKEKKKNNKKKDFTFEILVKEPDKNKIQVYNEEISNESQNINQENQEISKKVEIIPLNKIEDFDDIPISTSSNNMNTNMNSEENILNNNDMIMIPKKNSIEEFNKKIELALEQEKQEQINKENNDSNLNNNSKKMDKDDIKFDGIKELLGKEICESLSSPKWEIKKHGFELINTFVNETEESSYRVSDLFELIRLKLKNFKETNFNIIREAMNIFISMLKKRILSKENLLLLLNTYYEKIGDIKLKESIIELINTSIEESIIDPSHLISNLISKILKKNNMKILIEYSILFSKMVEDFDVKDLPIKELINFCKYMAGNSNPQVRTSATNLICVIYKYVGEDIKILIKDIKESTLKIIEAELEKVTVIEKKDQNKKKKNVNNKKKGEIFEGNNTNKKRQSMDLELVGPVDISKKLNSQLLKDLSEGKWVEKKEACEAIEKILNDANMKILPNGLNDLFNLIKNKLSDGNKNLVKILISLVNKFIQCLKKEFKPWTKMIALSLIPNLSDKNQSIKNECQLCFEKWVELVGIDTLVIYFPQFLKNDNVEMRIEIMKFIKKYNDKFPKNIAENVYKELIDNVLICLQDRSNNVRNEAEDIIKLSLSHVNIDTYYKKANDFKPAIAKDLTEILDNILENRYLKEENEHNSNDNRNLNVYSMDLSSPNDLNNQLDSPTFKNLNIKEKIRNSLKMKKSSNAIENTNINISNLASGNLDEKINYNSDYMSGEEEPEIAKKNTNNIKEKNSGINSSNIKKRKSMNKTAEKEKEKLKKSTSKLYEGGDNNKDNKVPLSSNSTVLRSNKKSNNSMERKPKMQRRNTLTKNNKFKNNIFISNNIKLPQNKAKRIELDKKFKFTIDTMTKDDINKLKETSKMIFKEEFYNKIFSTDFKKEVEALKNMKNNLDEKENISLYFEHLDIILKVISLKMNNVLNPALIKSLFLFLDSLYNILNENDYKLSEIESNIIICLLIDKLSLNNNQLKEHLFNLINQYIELFDVNKSGLIILNYALSKNNKTKSNVLDMIIELYLNKKINIKSKNYLKILSKYLLVNDNIVKSKCLTIFREIQEIIKEELWNIKDIGEKERAILENNLLNNEENEDENNENNENNNNDNNQNNENDEEENHYNQYDDYNDGENEDENIENENREEGYEESENNIDSDEEIYNNNYDDEEEENNEDNNRYNNFNNEEDERYEENEYNNEITIGNNNNENNYDEENNEKYYLNNEDIKHKHSNIYKKTENKVEDKKNIEKYNQKNQTFYKNNDIISKIQKLQNKNNKNDNSSNFNIKKEKEEKKPVENKFVFPKKIVVKQKKSNNVKKIKNSNPNNNKNNNKNLNFNSNNINNNYINNNIINNYYNNNTTMPNNNNDLSISLYNDMTINNNQAKKMISNNFSSSTLSSEKELFEIMNNLFSEDDIEKMNSIIIIHEILCSKYQENKFILIPNIDNIIKIIIQITHELFDCIDNLNNKVTPLKFPKYLVTILCKLTSNKELIIHISYKVLYDLCYELLNDLLINGLDKIGSNQEGNIIFKSLNSTMLRVIENCDTTSVILALLEIIKQNQNNTNLYSLTNLAIKCLIKATQNVQSIINNIQLDKILYQMHLLTYNSDKISSNNIEQNSQSDIIIIRFIKNFINDVVKIKKTDIMEDYNKSLGNNQYKYKFIYTWIKSSLELIGCSIPGENDNNDSNENDNDENNKILRTTSNNRATSTNINKNRINNSDKKRENSGNNIENKASNNNLNKKNSIVVKKHGNNSINNRYNINSHNIHSGINNINVTKSSILGSSSVSGSGKITIQKNNLKNSSQIYKGNLKVKKKYKK